MFFILFGTLKVSCFNYRRRFLSHCLRNHCPEEQSEPARTMAFGAGTATSDRRFDAAIARRGRTEVAGAAEHTAVARPGTIGTRRAADTDHSVVLPYRACLVAHPSSRRTQAERFPCCPPVSGLSPTREQEQSALPIPVHLAA